MRTSEIYLLFPPSSNLVPWPLLWKHLLRPGTMTAATAFSFQPHNQTVSTISLSAHTVDIACFYLSSEPFLPPSTGIYFSLHLFCIDFWQLSALTGLNIFAYSLENPPKAFQQELPPRNVSDSICHCRQNQCYFPRYLYGKHLAPTGTTRMRVHLSHGIIKHKQLLCWDEGKQNTSE